MRSLDAMMQAALRLDDIKDHGNNTATTTAKAHEAQAKPMSKSAKARANKAAKKAEAAAATSAPTQQQVPKPAPKQTAEASKDKPKKYAKMEDVKIKVIAASCFGCGQRKSSLAPHPGPARHRATKPPERIFSDNSGPHEESVGGNKYTTAFVDNCTPKKWTYYLTRKGEILVGSLRSSASKPSSRTRGLTVSRSRSSMTTAAASTIPRSSRLSGKNTESRARLRSQTLRSKTASLSAAGVPALKPLAQ